MAEAPWPRRCLGASRPPSSMTRACRSSSCRRATAEARLFRTLEQHSAPMTSGRVMPTIGVMPATSDHRLHQSLRPVLDEHERERSELAHELHEHVAQALAAVLFGLDGLAKRTNSEEAAPMIASLRGQVADTLEYCTDLAVELRPPLLDQLGLVPALESLAQRTGAARVSVDPALSGSFLGP